MGSIDQVAKLERAIISGLSLYRTDDRNLETVSDRLAKLNENFDESDASSREVIELQGDVRRLQLTREPKKCIYCSKTLFRENFVSLNGGFFCDEFCVIKHQNKVSPGKTASQWSLMRK